MPRKRKSMERLEKTGVNSIALKPETEQYLFTLQLIYTSLRDKQSWNEIFLTAHSYTNSIILKLNTGKKFVCPTIIDQKLSKAVSEFMERFLEEDFKIEASFAGSLKWKALESFYGTKEEDVHVSLNSLVGDGSHSVEDGQEASKFNNFFIDSVESVEDSLVRINLYQEVLKIFQEFDEIVKSPKLRVLIRLYTFLEIRGPRTKHIREFFYKNHTVNNKEKLLLKTTQLELYKRLREKE